MKVAICDDEITSVEVLKAYAKKTKQIKQIKIYLEPEILLEEIRRGFFFDLIFMDIDLGRSCNGIDVASEIFEMCPNTQTIFVTGYNDKFSQNIFLKPVNLCGYLVKPFDIELYNKIILKAILNKEKQKEEWFWFKNKGKIQSVSLCSIHFFESRGHRVYINLGEEMMDCYEKLEEIKEKLPTNFIQCHKSFIANMDYVQRIEQRQIFFPREKTIPISKSKYMETREAYFRYIGDNM